MEKCASNIPFAVYITARIHEMSARRPGAGAWSGLAELLPAADVRYLASADVR
jgi:hypothetical protein